MTKILYLHGFASAADSTKANLIASFVKNNTSSTQILIPDLDNDIENAYHQIDKIIESESPSSIIGSSLGGFYATYFSHKYKLLCVNINPAVPPIDMSEYLGENQNYSTGEKFIITPEDIRYIRKMSYKKYANAENTYVLLESGDEVLNYKETAKYFSGSYLDIIYGGSHSYESLDEKLKNIVNFIEIH